MMLAKVPDLKIKVESISTTAAVWCDNCASHCRIEWAYRVVDTIRGTNVATGFASYCDCDRQVE